MRTIEEAAAEHANNSLKASSRNVQCSAVNTFNAFAWAYRTERPVMWMAPSGLLDTPAFVHNEITLCLFATYMLLINLSSDTTSAYLSLVRTHFKTQMMCPLTLKEWEIRLPMLLRGIKRMHSRVRKGRLGLRAHHHRSMRAIVGPPVTEVECMQDAMLCLGREGLARGQEMVPAKSNGFDAANHMTVGDIKFKESQAGQEYMEGWIRPLKKGLAATEKLPVPLPRGDGIADAYSAVQRYLSVRRARCGFVDDIEPLFPRVTTGSLRALVKAVCAWLGLDPSKFGCHSLRIGGGTDHFAAETPALALQISGRWDSDIFKADSPPPPPPTPAPPACHPPPPFLTGVVTEGVVPNRSNTGAVTGGRGVGQIEHGCGDRGRGAGQIEHGCGDRGGAWCRTGRTRVR